jgi:putative endonuclease
MNAPRPWYLYVVECADGTFYTGISTDVSRRVAEHNAGRGARYTASRRPVSLQAIWRFENQKTALQAEGSFKRKNRPTKERTVAEHNDFYDGVWLPMD